MQNKVLDLARDLIRSASVTPLDDGAQQKLAAYLSAHGFDCHHLPFEEVPNLFARIGTSGPHLCFAGHTDVVPPGDTAAWTHGPFNPVVENGVLYGRGASDMKGAVAAFAVAAAEFAASNPNFKGSISLLITGDEEGPAINGTVKVLEWMKANGHVPDVAIVGEPTNPDQHGQEIKIGRRGSISGVITVTGRQGHVAYQHLADNPLPRLIKLLNALAAHRFDAGNEFFPPTNLEITSIDVGNTASNVIPASGRAAFNVRFTDKWSADSITRAICEILDSVGAAYDLKMGAGPCGSFLTPPGPWSAVVRDAVKDITGKTAAYTTNGGTSDARFIHVLCPVVEYGGVNATIHQVDENTGVAVLEDLVKIYRRILDRYFAIPA